MLANSTVSQSQNTISHANHVELMTARTVLHAAPISTMNITGLRHSVRGSSLRNASGVELQQHLGVEQTALHPFRGRYAQLLFLSHRGIVLR